TPFPIHRARASRDDLLRDTFARSESTTRAPRSRSVSEPEESIRTAACRSGVGIEAEPSFRKSRKTP
ncbi:MAG TPA: hypothetical protein VKA74_11490, partial [Myxococcota bacterium]|nr:hypothetical protein [Myxococcota bacterium]